MDSPAPSPKSRVNENQSGTGFVATGRLKNQGKNQQTCFPLRSMSLSNRTGQPDIGTSDHYADKTFQSPLLQLNSDEGFGMDPWSCQIDRNVTGWDASESSVIPPLLLSLSFTIQEEISNYLSNDTVPHQLGSNATLLTDDLSNVVLLPNSHPQSVLNSMLLEECIWS